MALDERSGGARARLGDADGNKTLQAMDRGENTERVIK